MNVTLKRTAATPNGIFGEILDPNGETVCVTLEHAFKEFDGVETRYVPALPSGTYTCKLGTHNLDHSQNDKLYQVMDVPRHTGILIHVGNYNRDSDGCILVGTAQTPTAITGSKAALGRFMSLQGGEDFTLTVEDIS